MAEWWLGQPLPTSVGRSLIVNKTETHTSIQLCISCKGRQPENEDKMANVQYKGEETYMHSAD